MPAPSPAPATPRAPYRVLFLCTGNSARSILAESILNREGGGRFVAQSAGSRPAGRVHPLALALLAAHGLPVDGLRSKSWDEFARGDAPAPDFVVTVCDAAAGEACPAWPGRPVTAHWSVPDPAAVEGDDDAKRRAFTNTLHLLLHRIRLFTSLPLETLDRRSLATRVQAIGRAGTESPA